MFGSKPAQDANDQTQGPNQRFEYLAESFVGNGGFNKGVNALARDGWEVVSVSFNGMSYHVCLKRDVSRTA